MNQSRERSSSGATPVQQPSSGTTEATFPRLLRALAAERGDAVAMQEKRYGIWAPITWAEYERRVTNFAHGLATLEVEAGEVVAVLGDNRPEWLIAELAAQSIGAAVVGIYPTSLGQEIVHVLTLAEVGVIVAEDQEQVDKLIRLAPELPNVRAVVYYDPRGLEGYTEPYLRSFPDIEDAGARAAAERPGWLDRKIDEASAADTAVICTTSGTTARPKLAELSHANLLAMAEHLHAVDPGRADDRYVSFLPFAWIGEQMLAVACGLSRGFPLSFPEDAATQRADLREIGPNVLFSPPRIWESMLSDVQVRLREADRLKRAAFRWGHAVGEEVARRRVRGERPGRWLRWKYRLADAIALRPVRDQLGLARLDRGYTGGAPLGPDVFAFFHALGVNLKQIYGQTEICGIAVVHRDDDIRFHTVGAPIPGTELRIADDGEILLRSESVFRGYHKNPESTAETVDAEGWLHTGDAGYLDDGHLVVIDRVKEVRRTADGQLFSAAFVENKLKFSPYVDEAVMFGGETGSEVSAMIILDPVTTGAWAEHKHLSYTTYTDLAGKDAVYELIADAVARANVDLPEGIRVRRFLLLHKQLDPDDDEVTRTRKVRRGVITERYTDIIAALDRGDAQVTVDATVTYQDGTTIERRTPLRIHTVTRGTGDSATSTGVAEQAAAGGAP